jgi:hypothetical protein
MDGNAPCVALYEPARPAEPAFHAALRDHRLRLLIHRVATTLSYLVIP